MCIAGYCLNVSFKIADIGATQDSILPNYLIFVVVTVFVMNLDIFDNSLLTIIINRLLLYTVFRLYIVSGQSTFLSICLSICRLVCMSMMLSSDRSLALLKKKTPVNYQVTDS